MTSENNIIKKDEWYEFALINGDKYEGMCIEEPFLNKANGFLEARFSCKNSKENDFSDFTIPLNQIKNTKHLMVKKSVGNNIWEIKSYVNNGKYIFGIFYYNKSDIEKIAKEVISSKKEVKTYNSMKEAAQFLENIN